jgi:S-adenosylmethionine:tRNA ribosyltransferase-isomerase
MEREIVMITSIPELNYAKEARLNRTFETKLLILSGNSSKFDTLNNLPNHLSKNDVLVVNDSAVIPGSFQAYHYQSNELIELRLVRFLGKKTTDISKWQAITYGEGNWRIPTEKRNDPPKMTIGDLIIVNDLIAKIIEISFEIERLLTIEFLGEKSEIIRKIYYYGNLIQYSYLKNHLELWDHQTLFSSYPVSIEPSSSAFQLNWKLLFKFQKIGIKIIPITHAISISNTGIAEIDTNLPLDERYWISKESAANLNLALDKQSNIITIGTSVTRALESIMLKRRFFIEETDQVNLKIDKNHNIKVVNGLLTGMHMFNESHINLLEAFAPIDIIDQEYTKAIEKKFLWHEYGDTMLIRKD